MDEKKKTIKGMALGRKDIFRINPLDIHEKEGFNARLDYGDLTSLVDYVLEHGNVPSPLKVWMEDGTIYVDQGHRRLRAVHMAIEKGADVKTVDCIAEPVTYNPEMRLIEMVSSNEGMPLSMLEQGHVFRRLTGGGYEQIEVARKVAKSPSHVSNCIILANASKRIQNLIIEGKVKPTTVLGVLRDIIDEDAQFAALTTAIESAESDGKTVATPGRVRAASGSGGASGKPTVAKKVKDLTDWVDENSVILSERPKFKMISHVLGYLRGELTIEQLAVFTD